MIPGSRAPRRRLPVAALLVVLAACGGDAPEPETAAADSAPAARDVPTCDDLTSVPVDSMETTETGLHVLRVREGEGRAAAPGDTVTAHYLGCLTDGTKFDASYDRNEPISFPLGTGRVIQGWDQGLQGMKPGGIRVLRIPPELGYGARGAPQGNIPPDATLLFRVEMVEVTPGGGA